MLLNELLMLKFPKANFLTDIILQDDGHGPYIKEWNYPGLRPTQIELDQWTLDLQPYYNFEQNKVQNTRIYKQLEEIDLKSIRAMRVGDTQRLQVLEQEAINLRNQLLPTG